MLCLLTYDCIIFYKGDPCLMDIYTTIIDNGSNINLVESCYLDKDRVVYYCKLNNLMGINSQDIPTKYIDLLSIKDLFTGIKITLNRVDRRTLINLIEYYLILNEYYICGTNIYCKIVGCKISYRLVGSIKNILYEEFQTNVALYFINNFKNYFKGFDFSYLLDNYLVGSEVLLEDIVCLSTQKIKFNYSLIEFKDGVYSIKYDRFFPNKKNYVFSNKVSTLKYYDKYYSWVRQNKPES